MKRSILLLLSVIAFLTTVQLTNAQEKIEKWPGVTVKILTDNDKVTISEVTFAPGAVATWHSHPQYTVYALTDIKMKVEIEGKEAVVADVKAGQAMWSPAVTHQTTNVGKKSFTAIVTEMK